MRTIPKEAGKLAVNKPRPITLLNAKAKWVTGTMKLCLQDFLNVMVPIEQKGFVKGRKMEAHLHNVMHIQASNVKAAWVSIDFLKAYDKMGHQIIEALLNVAGMERQLVRILIAFMKEELGFLVANKVANTWIRPRGGIRQGDSLSPALFVLVTAILCIMLRKQMPQTVPMLYADDTLIWIPGNVREIEQELRTLK